MTNDLMRDILRHAGQAPSLHNSQPWRFEVDGWVVDLRADRDRALPATDPSGRQLVLSCGAALEFLCVAALAAGRQPVVSLLPQPSAPDWLARVDLSAACRSAADDDAVLVDAMARRHTVRAPFDPTAVDPSLVRRLVSEAERAGAWAVPLNRRDDVLRSAVLLSHADEAERESPDYLTELQAWRRDNGTDGVPATALAPTAGRRTSLTLRDFAAAEAPADTVDPGAGGETGPAEQETVLVVGTDGDGPTDWVVAGRALARLWLRATALGLAASPLTQVLDREPYRGALRRALNLQGHAQMLLRVGYGRAEAGAPRRPVDEIATGLDTDPPATRG